MTPDIVERLRAYVEYVRCGTAPEEYLEWEAADEIERLQDALREIDGILYRAFRALEPKP